MLGAHENLIPAVERNRGVVRVADPSPGEDGGAGGHLLPELPAPLSLRQCVERLLAEAGRVTAAHIHDCPPGTPGGVLHDVWLATATAERLVVQKHRRPQVADGKEEPLALPDKCRVAAPPALLGSTHIGVAGRRMAALLNELDDGIDQSRKAT